MVVQIGGYDWTSAGEMEVGWVSPFTLVHLLRPGGGYSDVSAWWKFTSGTDQRIGFTTEFSKSYDGLEPDTNLTIYTGASYDTSDSVFSAFQISRNSGSSVAARGAFDCLAGVEYHIEVWGANIEFAALGVGTLTSGELIQDPNVVRVDVCDMSAGTPEHSGDTTYTRGTTYNGHYHSGGGDDFAFPGTATEAELQTLNNQAADLTPALSLDSSTNGVSSGAVGSFGSVASNSDAGFGSTYHNWDAGSWALSSGFSMHWHSLPYEWDKDEYEWDFDAYAVEYEPTTALTTYLGTEIEFGCAIYHQGWDSETLDMRSYLTVDLNLSPDPNPGTGRTVDTLTANGYLIGVGEPGVSRPWDELRTKIIRVPIEEADINSNGVVYFVAQQPIKTGVWIGQHLGTSPNDSVTNSIAWSWVGPNTFAAYPVRYDTHRPPQYRYQYMAPLQGPPQGEIDGVQDIDRSAFTPWGQGG